MFVIHDMEQVRRVGPKRLILPTDQCQAEASAGSHVLAAAAALLTLALALLAAAPPISAAAASPRNPASPAETDMPAVSGSQLPCLVVATSGCPLAPASAPIPVQVPGNVVVFGANWMPGASVTVLLVAAIRPCSAPPDAMEQAHASTAGVFALALPLPAAAANDTLYAVCATTADGKQTFPSAGLTVQSPLRLRVSRPPSAATSTPRPPIDGFSLAALVLAALAAGVFAFSRLRRRRPVLDAD